MKRLLTVLLAVLMICGIAVPAAGAADLTTEQKYEVLKQKGIFSGFSDGSAGLYQSMTREQFAQVLSKLLELPASTRPASYTDVLKTRWSYAPVEAVTAAGLMVGTGTRKFSPDSPVTVEQLAAVLIRAYGWSGGNGVYVVGKVSAWARPSVAIALQNQLIPQMKDYTITATRALLVEASYAVYMRTHGETLVVKSVVPVANQQLRVNLNQTVTAADKSHFLVRDIYGSEASVLATVVASDGLSVTVITERLTAGRNYSLFVDGAAWTFTALNDDTAKPVVSSFSKQLNGTLQVIFSEPVDKSSATNKANYSLSGGLRVTDVRLSDDARVATVTTSSQSEGATYRLYVKNVKDLSGNVMNDWSGDFTADSKAPTASFRFNVSTAVITVIFSEKVNPDAAKNTGRYAIDKGLSVTRAELDSDGKTVYLTTSAQKDATIYTLTVSGIPDLAGNMMAAQSFSFGGVAHPEQSVQLQSVSAVNENTVELSFDRALSDADVAKLGIAILTDNGSSVSMSGWSTFKQRKSDKAVTVQFRTSGDGNPALFRAGHVYTARATGIDNLVTANGANEKSFAGTEAENPVPYVTQVTALSASTVKIVFSEPVKNVTADAFIVREKDGDAVASANVGTTDKGDIVKEVVLKLGANLSSGHLYVMKFRAGTVTDAAGWNGFRTKNGSDDYVVEFRGV